MKKLLIVIGLIPVCFLTYAQQGVKYDASIQSTGNLQYWKAKGDLFVGDCIPFSKDGTYYYYWLLDSAHHAGLKGLGGHQWALSTSSDLKTWKQYPLVLDINEEWEKSICTGSVVFYKNKYYAFYATRLVDKEGEVNEQLSYAVSPDGVSFKKQKPNPFYTSAPGYSKRDFRDPKVFVDEKTGEFHLFVSSWKENSELKRAGGCLVHLTSKDLKKWTVQEPVLTGQTSVPECPDYFLWNGWYYLVYSDNGDTYYVKSKNAYGPWQEPQHQTLNESWSNVVKTAEFRDNRRIAAAWIPSRNDNKDNGNERFGGNSIFREISQEPDGTLSSKFPKEMIPETGAQLKVEVIPGSYSTITNDKNLQVDAPNGVGAAHSSGIPLNSRVTLEIEPEGVTEEYGLYLRSDEKAEGGYRLNFSANTQIVSLANTDIKAVKGLDKTIKVDIILKDDIIDVCIDNRRCIVNRLPEQIGDFLWFYAKHGKVKFKSISVSPLAENK